MANTNLKVRLILYDRGNILLLRQKKSLGGNYTLVGGTIEEKEYAVEALIRESKEEAGLLLNQEDLQLVHVLHKRTNSNGHRITLYFKATKWAGKIITGEPNKFKGVDWFSLENLPSNLSDTVQHVLQEYRDGRMYSEFKMKPKKA
ncbi:MAG: NUDIX domain-containing protein [Saprospiraceae bacterium]|nr:NUDIX domain-containing protein [Saprospiraceae bacterium]MCF8252256.1 NUDIX domain-containing protein [Saprospiraceae bacterium]MCF8313915.1 NUDIX domain-containing protein [Saprospiraceae bacterium]MCF8443248.1 NUDIX domain-containing protein [Saprospiraceae bacterium]